MKDPLSYYEQRCSDRRQFLIGCTFLRFFFAQGQDCKILFQISSIRVAGARLQKNLPQTKEKETV